MWQSSAASRTEVLGNSCENCPKQRKEEAANSKPEALNPTRAPPQAGVRIARSL